MRQVANRLATGVLSIVGVLVLSFIALRIIPGNPAQLILGQGASQASIKALSDQMHLNAPLWQQFVDYVRGFLSGNLGYSTSYGESVAKLLESRLPATLELATFSFVCSMGAAIVLALVVARWRSSRVARITSDTISLLSLSLPEYWLGIVLLLLLSAHLGLFPGPEGRLSSTATPPTTITGFYTIDSLLTGHLGLFLDAVWHLLLPAFVLGLSSFGFVFRLLRANLLEVADEPFLLVKESHGLSQWRVLVRHALPNAIPQVLIASSTIFANMVVADIFVEQIFQWPGIGQLVFTSIQNQDFSLAQGFVLVAATWYVVLNVLTEVAAVSIDPRVREQAA